MAQKVNLQIENNTRKGKGETFVLGGEKLLAHDLTELGLEEHTAHMRIRFDNEKTISYSLCGSFVISLVSMVLWPFFIMLYPCIRYNIRKWTESRLAAVTDTQLVLKQGYYGCCCCCWNESTKSVPLNKITDLQIQQGCIQQCFDVREIRVETASASSEMPEMRLIGLHDALNIRRQILKVRDSQSANTGTYNPASLQQQSPQQSTEELQQIVTSQQETMVQIKDVLSEMRTCLQCMDAKMNNGDKL